MIRTQEDARTKSSHDDVRQQFIDNRDDKSYRHAYSDESLNLSIATQIKVLREQRQLRQKDLALLAGMKQSMISRYEDVNYSSWSINTLKKLAEAFDVVLDVRFRSFNDLVTITEGFSRETLQVPSFCDDPYFVGVAPAARAHLNPVTFVYSPVSRVTQQQANQYAGYAALESLYGGIQNNRAAFNSAAIGAFTPVNQSPINPKEVIYAKASETNISSGPLHHQTHKNARASSRLIRKKHPRLHRLRERSRNSTHQRISSQSMLTMCISLEPRSLTCAFGLGRYKELRIHS